MRILAITILSFLFFLGEFAVFNVFGGWLKPDLLLILVVFFSLYLGIRHGLITAFIAGFIRDSFSIQIFGLAIVSLLFCSYMTIFIKRYLNYIGSGSSRTMIVFWVSIVNVGIYFLLSSIFYDFSFRQVVLELWFPEIILTTLVAGYTFQVLLRCVKRFGI